MTGRSTSNRYSRSNGITGLMNQYISANFTTMDAMVATIQELYGYTFIFGIGVMPLPIGNVRK